MQAPKPAGDAKFHEFVRIGGAISAGQTVLVPKAAYVGVLVKDEVPGDKVPSPGRFAQPDAALAVAHPHAQAASSADEGLGFMIESVFAAHAPANAHGWDSPPSWGEAARAKGTL